MTSSVERTRRKERTKERGIMPPPPARTSTIPSKDKKIQLPSRNTTAQRHQNMVPSDLVRREPPARRPRSPGMRGEEGSIIMIDHSREDTQKQNRSSSLSRFSDCSSSIYFNLLFLLINSGDTFEEQ
ncbi:hypothetical protein L6452_41826 [Arctium lappa]|uniref:Uncharacterized protein n=1 Tax=Arctium lappa TaxID=4217 RepID=A0ACB8XH26_ARCLA|nr:hypothetical protein L6452_41826 [Arctium lappa]